LCTVNIVQQQRGKKERKSFCYQQKMMEYVWFVLWFLGALFGIATLYSIMEPVYVLHSGQALSDMRDYSGKMVGMIHAILTTLFGFGYMFYMVTDADIERIRIISTAYLLYDTYICYIRAKETSPTNINSPVAVAFHHILTIMFMYGFYFNGSIYGCVAFYIGELPIVFLNLSWFYYYMSGSASNQMEICNILCTLTYFLCRMIAFPIFFLFVLRNDLSFSIGTIFFIPMLISVYGLNGMWFYKLLKRSFNVSVNNPYPALPFMSKMVACSSY